MSNPVGAMFGRIAGVYDLLNHILSLGIDISWRRELAAILPKGQLFLDLAAGTLDVSLALRRLQPDARILALDFCPPMLEKGLPKIAKAHCQGSVMPCAADALRLPLPDKSVDGITIAFGIRNIKPRIEAFQEMRRVLKPGGRLCVLEFGSASERIWGGIYNFYLETFLPAIGKVLARDKAAYVYLARTIKQFPTAPVLAREMEQAGFGQASFRKLTGGIVCLHWADKGHTVSATAARSAPAQWPAP